jgi:hypothetical protein
VRNIVTCVWFHCGLSTLKIHCLLARFLTSLAEQAGSVKLRFDDLFSHLHCSLLGAPSSYRSGFGASKLVRWICWCLLFVARLFFYFRLICCLQTFFTWGMALLLDGWVGMSSQCTLARHVLSLLFSVLEAGCFCHGLHWKGCGFWLWRESNIVFRSGCRSWLNPSPGFDQVIGSLGLIFFLNQNDIVLIKKKLNRLQPSFWSGLTGSTGSHQVFPSFIFSSTRSRVDLPGQAEFQNYAWKIRLVNVSFSIHFLLFFLLLFW